MEISVNEGIMAKLVETITEGYEKTPPPDGFRPPQDIVVADIRNAQNNVIHSLGLNKSGAANFLAKKRSSESVDVILRRTERTTRGGLFAE